MAVGETTKLPLVPMVPETAGDTVTEVAFVVWKEMVAASPALMLVGVAVQDPIVTAGI